MNDRDGYTYVEVLMAAALLSIFIMPVLAGFFNAAQNQRYSREVYEASLYACNLLAEAAESTAEAADFETLLCNPAFETEYRTDLFDYCLYIYDQDDTLSCLKTDAGLPDSAPPVLTGGGSGSANIQITAAGDYVLDMDGDTDIFVTVGGIVITCENNTGAPVILNIYTADPGSITLDCRPETADITVFFTSPPPVRRVLMAEVYNKKSAVLSRLAVPAER